MSSPNKFTLPDPMLAGVAGLYCTGEEFLRITSANAVASVSLTLGGRFLQLGELRPLDLVARHVPASDRSFVTSDVKLGEGWLQGLTIVADAGSPPSGACFVRVDLIRGSGASATFLQTLMQGYVTGSQRLAWPEFQNGIATDGPGRLRSITGTDPAAGAEISETVPTGARWRLYAVSFTLVTDATVANREVEIVLDDGATPYVFAAPNANQAASLTRHYTAGHVGARGAAATAPGILISIPPIVLAPGHRIRTLTTNLQAGDNFGAPQLMIEEWIEAA